MDWQHLQWKDGVEAVLAIVLLKILYDCVYVKIPRGFKSVRTMLETQTERGNERHGEAMKMLQAVQDAVKGFTEKKCKGHGRLTRAAATKRKPKAT